MRHEPSWRTKMVINAFGSVCTFIVIITFAVTKFVDGAWIVVLLIPTMVLIFLRIHHHYARLAAELSLDHCGATARPARQRVILALGGVHRGSIAALSYAMALSDDITAVYVSIDPEETAKVRHKWELWGEGVRLVVLNSPYRLLIEPLLAYVEKVAAHRQPNETITIIVPQFVPKHFWENVLHSQTALILRMALLFRPGIVITEVPYHIQ